MLLEQRFCRTGVNNSVECDVDLVQRQNKIFIQHLVDLVVINFSFDLVPPFYCLK